MTEIREAGPGHQSHVARTDHDDAHNIPSSRSNGLGNIEVRHVLKSMSMNSVSFFNVSM
jgi:hypothetical protein